MDNLSLGYEINPKKVQRKGWKILNTEFVMQCLLRQTKPCLKTNCISLNENTREVFSHYLWVVYIISHYYFLRIAFCVSNFSTMYLHLIWEKILFNSNMRAIGRPWQIQCNLICSKLSNVNLIQYFIHGIEFT